MTEAAKTAGATVVKTVFHHFSPHGISGVVVIAESHLAVHTWPEHGYASIDIFTCGEAALTERIAEHLLTALQPRAVTRRLSRREPPAISQDQ